MKKVLAICLALVMVVSMCLPAWAVSDNFLESPSNRVGPELVGDASGGAEDCVATIRVVPFANRDIMDEDMRKELEEAYDTIVNVANVGDLNSDLSKLAADQGIHEEYLVVSDLFDAHLIGCDLPHHHGTYTITLTADMLERFVGLLRYYNGAWELVDNAKVVDGKLVFSESKFSPFAIVINMDPDFVDPSQGENNPSQGGEDDNPPTGDDSHIGIYIAVMVVAGLAMIALWRSSKKQSSK